MRVLPREKMEKATLLRFWLDMTEVFLKGDCRGMVGLGVFAHDGARCE